MILMIFINIISMIIPGPDLSYLFLFYFYFLSHLTQTPEVSGRGSRRQGMGLLSGRGNQREGAGLLLLHKDSEQVPFQCSHFSLSLSLAFPALYFSFGLLPLAGRRSPLVVRWGSGRGRG